LCLDVKEFYLHNEYLHFICITNKVNLFVKQIKIMARNSHVLLTSSQLGQILQTSRRSKKMSQAALAVKLGLSQSRVSHLEKHAEELSVEQLMNWCTALGLELAVGLRGSSAVDSPKLDW
jgi:HTH-type transcriptional regulator/antitoxin HipB